MESSWDTLILESQPITPLGPSTQHPNVDSKESKPQFFLVWLALSQPTGKIEPAQERHSIHLAQPARGSNFRPFRALNIPRKPYALPSAAGKSPIDCEMVTDSVLHGLLCNCDEWDVGVVAK